MPYNIQLSGKVSVDLFPDYCRVSRTTIRGKRYVNLPMSLIMFCLSIRDLIDRTKASAQDATKSCIATPFPDWKLEKSFFCNIVYLGFVKLKDGERFG